MWEDEPKRTGRPYLWILFLLLLLGMNSIFFLRPEVISLSQSQTPAAGGDLPVVTLIDARAHGKPLFSAGAQTGVWAVHAEGDGAVIRFLSALGDEQWVERVPVGNVLIASSGRYLAVGQVGQAKFYVYHARQKLVAAVATPGALQALSISRAGEVVAAFTVSEADPLTLRAEIALYSALGHLTWRHSLAEQQPIAVKQSADGNTVALLSLDFAQEVTGRLTIYSRQGERLSGHDLKGRPGLLAVRDDGEGVAVTSGNSIREFDRQGHLTLRYDAGGAVAMLRYHGSHPTFVVLRRALLNLRSEHRAIVLGENGRVVMEHRSVQPIVALTTFAPQGDIFIGTADGALLVNYDGQPRWNLAHTWQDAYRVSTLDGVHYLVIRDQGQVVQVRGQ